MLIKILQSILFLLICLPMNAAIIYITPSGDGLLNGSSWQNAFPGTNLQAAINSSNANDTLWVASGSYYPTSTNNRSVSFSMRNDIAIIGSFQGHETHSNQRELTCGPSSVLSGNIGVSENEFDNSYTIIVNYDLNNSAVLDGFEIRDGYDNRSISSIENGLGGGVYNGGNGNGNSCSPTFKNCVIVNNFAGYGAGMFNNGIAGGNSEPILINCVIAFNHATIGGGGMDSYGWNNGDVAPVLINCLMYHNVSDDRAGAMYCWGGLNGNCSPSIINSAIINNTSINIAGGVIVDNSNNLAGTAPYSGTAEVLVQNSIFWGNTAAEGPQFFILGTGNLNATYSNIDMTDQLPAHPISGQGTGNIFTDPNFLNVMNAIGMDGCWMTADDGINLQISSLSINVGYDGSNEQEVDLTNRDRISGAGIDIGPYEYQLLDSVSWTGNTNLLWENDSNWSPARVPDATQHVTIPNNLLNYPLIHDSSYAIRSLLLEDNAEIQVSGTGALNVIGN